MPAPDLGPSPVQAAPEMSLAVHLLPALVDPSSLAGSVVIMIDALRASVTISSALHAGAERVIPALTVEEARRTRDQLLSSGVSRDLIVLGGERGGVLIPGFDLDNSPLAYTAERVAGRTVVFTTANGTSTLLHAKAASRVLIGALTNVSALQAAIGGDARPVNIICSGTRGEVSLDDCIAAGAIVEKLLAAGRHLVSDDSALLCLRLWKDAQQQGVFGAMRASRGGRNLAKLGLEPDIEYCSKSDVLPIVPEFFAATGEIVEAGR